ncbi:MAG: phosphatidate cytidylyltransferase [Saprospiraceae bacterium]|nr:phosphatidate cytidylyltransferase [Saprospiraceae bacterium]
MKGLLRRALTAVIFVAVMVGGLFGGHYSFVTLFLLITGLCLWEYLGLVLENAGKKDLIRKLLGLGMGILPFVLASIVQLNLISDRENFIVLASILFSPFVFLSFVYELYAGSEKPFTNLAYLILGVFYIGIPFALLDFVAFSGEYFYATTVLGLLLLTWTNDTMAYLIGSQIGKTPLFPRISPKKTWEGTLGGAAVSFIVAYLLSLYIPELSFINWMVLALIISVFGSLGDLVESMLKRSHQIKDSGSLLPGHGGFLDRFDGFIFMLPFAAAYLLWIR